MRRSALLILFSLLLFSNNIFAQPSGKGIVGVSDGSTTIHPYQIDFTGATVTDGGDGTADVAVSGLSTDSVGTDELNDGTDSPGTGECVKVDTSDSSIFMYESCGASGAGGWTDDGTNVRLTGAGDEVIIGATTPVNSSKLSVDGDADQIQTTIQAVDGQTTDIFVIEDSAGADILTGALGGVEVSTGVVINGTQDINQLIVRGHSTQNKDILTIENSSREELVKIDNNGRITSTDDDRALVPASCTFTVCSSTANGADGCDYNCDGTSDNVEIQAAENACPSAGCRICLSEGTFNLTSTVTIDQIPIAITGQGSQNGITKITQPNSTNLTNFLEVNIASDDQGLYISDIMFDGNDSGSNTSGRALHTGVGAGEAQDVVLNNLWVMNFASLYIEDAWGAIIQNLICEFNEDCLQFDNGNDPKVFNSKIQQNTGRAIILGASTGQGHILGNRLSGDSSGAILTVGGADHSVTDNSFLDSDGATIAISVTGNTNLIVGNTLKSSGTFNTGISMDAGSATNEIRHNRFTGTFNTAYLGKAGTNNTYIGNHDSTNRQDYSMDVRRVGIGTDSPGSTLDVVGDITLENDEVIDNSTNDEIWFVGTETLKFKLNTATNRVQIDPTGTGAELQFPSNIWFLDDNYTVFGTGADSAIRWITEGNDNLQLGLKVGSAAQTGHFNIVEYADLGNANRSPTATTTDPTLRIYSVDEAVATDYFELYHDQTDANINVGGGNLIVSTTSTGDSEVQLPNDSIGPAEIDSTTGTYDFSGVTAVSVPTVSADDNDTSAASTAYVQGEINGAGGTDLTCSSGQCNVDDSFIQNDVDDTMAGDLTITGNLIVDNDADQNVGRFQGHSTQTNDILVIEQSDGTDVWTAAVGGVKATGDAEFAANVKLSLSRLDCSGLSNGGALTTDANGNIVCSADDTGAGSGAFSDSADPVVLNTTSKDVNIGTTHNNTAKLSVDGDADQVQLSIQGNGTQTSNIWVMEQSDGTDIWTGAVGGIKATGNVIFDGNIGTTPAASPTISGPGDFGIDSTEAQWVYNDGGRARVIVPTFTACGTVENLADTDDNFEFYANARDIKVLGSWCHCRGTCTTEADLSFEIREVGTGTTTDITGTVDCEDTTTGDTKTSLSANVTALDQISFDVDNSPTANDEYQICIEYEYQRK